MKRTHQTSRLRQSELDKTTAECVEVQYWIFFLFFIALAKHDRTRTASFLPHFVASARNEVPAPTGLIFL